MTDTPMHITVQMTDDDADSGRVEEATLQLRDELRHLDVAVEAARGGDAPPGARAVNPLALGTLIVTLAQSSVLAALVTAVSDWLVQRHQGTIKIAFGGDVLELSGRPAPEQIRLAEAWILRHTPAELAPAGGRHALIVANYDYQDPGLRRLRAPARDAEQLARVLRDPAIGGFDVEVVLNESAAVLNERVEDFFADRGPDDLLLLHFAGHGVKDEAGELHFATATTRLNRLGATAVAADFVNRRMNRSRSQRIVLFLDCCYAGAFARGMTTRSGTEIGIEEQFGGRGRAVITASNAMEYAFEGDDLDDSAEGGSSVFTSALIEGLDTGDADRDQDGYIGLDELYDYVYEKVRRTTPNQTPRKWAYDLQGEFHIARRGRPVSAPAALPPEIQEAVDHPLASVRAAAVTELERLLTNRHQGLVAAAEIALRDLAADDSRTVSAAAAAALAPLDQAPAATPSGPDPTPQTAESTDESTATPSPVPQRRPIVRVARRAGKVLLILAVIVCSYGTAIPIYGIYRLVRHVRAEAAKRQES